MSAAETKCVWCNNGVLPTGIMCRACGGSGTTLKPRPGEKAVPVTARSVLFASSFRYDAAPNISHATLDGVRTLCGRDVAKAASNEDIEAHVGPDCLRCRKAWDRLPNAAEL